MPVGVQERRGPRLSVVVPCFGEEAVLPAFYSRCAAALKAAVGESYEIVFVNDGSRDGTWRAIRELVARDPNVIGVDLTRNFGHQLALSAGLSASRGDNVLTIDADLQHPPELIGPMLAEIEKGADVVYGQRTAHDRETAFKRHSARLFYVLMEKLSEVPIPRDVGDFRMMRRVVVDELMAMPEQNRFIRGMVTWLGFRQVAMPFERAPRAAGQTKYPLRRMLHLAFDGIASFSIMPLRLTSLFGLFFCLVAFGVVFYSLVAFFTGHAVPGWTSTIIIVALVGGIQLLSLGIVGEYLGRVYIEVKRRPLFLIREIETRSADRVASTDTRNSAP